MSNITNFKNILIESLRDNKKLIIGLYLLFILVFIAGWFISANVADQALDDIMSTNDTIANSTSIDDRDVSALELFINNEFGAIVVYISSIFFGISAIVMLIYNAFNISAVGPIFAKLFPGGSLQYIVYLIPHGIFEFTATVLESVAGILLFLFIWRFIKTLMSSETNGVGEAFEKTKKTLIQSLAIMVIVTILLIIAAPIEAYISIPFSNMLVGHF